MKAFSTLCTSLEAFAAARVQVTEIVGYFRSAPPEDAVWGLHLLMGRRIGRIATSSELREWTSGESDLPEWLFDESWGSVGDAAEAAALLIPEGRTTSQEPLHYWMERRLLPLHSAHKSVRREAVVRAWSEMDYEQRFVWNMLLTGGIRTLVPRKRVINALAEASGFDRSVLTLRLTTDWRPNVGAYRQILSNDTRDADRSRGYPFCPEHPLTTAPANLGRREHWQAEWMWPGLRAQLVCRGGRVAIWSRDGELVTERLPEIRDSARTLPDGTVLDGAVVAWRGGEPLPLERLRQRMKRRTVSEGSLRETPVSFMAFDLLELDGKDVRKQPLRKRRSRLETVLGRPTLRIRLGPVLDASSWPDLSDVHAQCRNRKAVAILLRALNAPYVDAPAEPVWWSWKADPYAVDVVLIYVETRARRGAALECTFAVWEGDELVPIARASIAAGREAADVERFAAAYTMETFGPVRSVEPKLVFEIGFDGVARTTRRRSGVKLRAPRVLRRRTGLRAADAATAADVRALASGADAGTAADVCGLAPGPDVADGTPPPTQETLRLF